MMKTITLYNLEEEIKIVPPEGYEMYVEDSTIKFKPIEKKRFVDDEDALIGGYFVRGCDIIKAEKEFLNNEGSYDIFATEKQAKSALAMARISQIVANDERFGGPITDEEWDNVSIKKYIIIRDRNKIRKDEMDVYTFNSFLAFHSLEQRDLFLQENEQLVKNYLMID